MYGLMDKNIARKNKILAAILLLLALISVAGAVTWFSIYAPLVLK
jgi:hypothetical protein